MDGKFKKVGKKSTPRYCRSSNALSLSTLLTGRVGVRHNAAL